MRRIVLALVLSCGPMKVQAQTQWPYGGPPMWDRGRNPEMERERRLPERSYDPYDRGTEDRYRGRRPIDREEYERRSFCVMHPRDCQ